MFYLSCHITGKANLKIILGHQQRKILIVLSQNIMEGEDVAVAAGLAAR